MGSSKALLDLNGLTFLQTILDKIERLELLSCVTVGHGADKVLANHDLSDVITARNSEMSAGPIGSIRASIKALEEYDIEALVVWPVDFPHVEEGTVAKLLREKDQKSRSGIIVPDYQGRGGHPAIFDSALFQELLAAPNDVGARAVVRKDPNRVKRVPVNDPAVVDCINTPQAYQALLSRVSSS